MCGICGLLFFDINRSVEKSVIEMMAESLSHRGRDDRGYFVKNNVGFGHLRLSIIDLSRGIYPISNEDGSVRLVSAGEIYNYPELRDELKLKGHVFRTNTDSEVIVHLYEDYGNDLCGKLNGMFSFALWDDNKKKLMLARDRLGIKPLYYALTASWVAFSSEIKGILAGGLVQPALNVNSLQDYFSFRYPLGSKTFFKGINKLLPGFFLTAEYPSKIIIKRYWSPKYENKSSLPLKDNADKARNLIRDSVRRNLISDVPVGVCLSGGIDSSIIAHETTELTKNNCRTYTVVTDDSETSEAVFADETARKSGLKNTLVWHSAYDYVNNLQKLIWHCDEPGIGWSYVALHSLANVANQDVKVLLDGNGGDEIFGGYDRFVVGLYEESLIKKYGASALDEKVIQKDFENAPAFLKKENFMRRCAMDFPSRYYDIVSIFNEQEKANLLNEDVLKATERESSPENMSRFLTDPEKTTTLDAMMNVDLNRYLPMQLEHADKIFLLCGIENRVPLLDHRIVEFFCSMPDELKISGFESKLLIKKAYENILPESVIKRSKKGFPLPLSKWMREGELREFTEDVLFDTGLKSREYLDAEYVKDTVKQHVSGRHNYSMRIWLMLCFELWLKEFF